MFDINKIKIVIWDLDDTFWHGTLSEGEITPITSNIELVKELTRHGIVNSICSKNDFKNTMDTLSRISDISDYFVFPSIDWTPKGQRIASTLKEMGLRAQNCLFVDDNIQNIEEAKYMNPDIMTAYPQELAIISDELRKRQTTDIDHKRLKQYKILENKRKAAKDFSDNTEFLFSSNIRVAISRDCENQLERIAELVIRSNQLNFTKRRDTKDEIKALIDDPECDTGYVTVTDNFGDYGMVGFFAIKNNRCIHLLFSCRTIGQGVEEYVYASLGHPKLTTIEPVANHLSNVPAPKWINQIDTDNSKSEKKQKTKIVFKGACDLSQVSTYIKSDNIVEEFSYIGERRHNFIEHHNHSTNYLQWWKLSGNERDKLISEIVFNDEQMFNTSIYDDDTALIVLSTMIEPHLGIYRNKHTGFRIAFAEAFHPLTDPKEWTLYTDCISPHGSKWFTEDWLKEFSQNYEFCGTLSTKEIIENAKQLLAQLPSHTKVCYLLGPEMRFENESNPTYIGREKIYKEVNDAFRELSASNPRVLLIDVNEWLHQQSDFTNNLNHWQRKIYYNIAEKVNEYINTFSNSKTSRKSRLYLHLMELKDRIRSIDPVLKLWNRIHGRTEENTI